MDLGSHERQVQMGGETFWLVGHSELQRCDSGPDGWKVLMTPFIGEETHHETCRKHVLYCEFKMNKNTIPTKSEVSKAQNYSSLWFHTADLLSSEYQASQGQASSVAHGFKSERHKRLIGLQATHLQSWLQILVGHVANKRGMGFGSLDEVVGLSKPDKAIPWS